MELAIILLIIAALVGILGFGITNLANHIARFLYFLVIALILILLLYGYFSFHPVTEKPSSQETQAEETTKELPLEN